MTHFIHYRQIFFFISYLTPKRCYVILLAKLSLSASAFHLYQLSLKRVAILFPTFFISTITCSNHGGERPCFEVSPPCFLKFQSTPPCGERHLSVNYATDMTDFQFTPPMRGATDLCRGNAPIRNHFNPRPPCGERHFQQRDYGFGEIFQSTPPMRGAT